MAELSIGDAVGAGFGVIRRRPAAVLLWGLVQTLVFAVTLAVLAPTWAEMVSEMARNGPAHPPSADVAGIMRLQGEVWLFNIAGAAVGTILYCGIFRSLIHPAQGQFAYLRLGATELTLFLLLVGFYVGFLIALFVAMIPAAIVISVLVAVHAGAAAAIVGVGLGAAALWALVYIGLRLSMIGPMTVDAGQLRLREAWALTKGRTWRLFLMTICLFLILLAVEFVVSIVGFLIVLSVLGGIAGGLQAVPSLLQQPANLLPHLAPLLIVGALAAIPLYGAFLAIFTAPWAKAYLAFRHNPAEAF